MGIEQWKYKYPKLDNLILGIIIGLIGPWIGFVIFYFIEFSHQRFIWYIHVFRTIPGIASPVLALSVIIDVVLLRLAVKAGFGKMSKGIFYSALAYAPVIVYLYFFH